MQWLHNFESEEVVREVSRFWNDIDIHLIASSLHPRLCQFASKCFHSNEITSLTLALFTRQYLQFDVHPLTQDGMRCGGKNPAACLKAKFESACNFSAKPFRVANQFQHELWVIWGGKNVWKWPGANGNGLTKKQTHSTARTSTRQLQNFYI